MGDVIMLVLLVASMAVVKLGVRRLFRGRAGADPK